MSQKFTDIILKPPFRTPVSIAAKQILVQEIGTFVGAEAEIRDRAAGMVIEGVFHKNFLIGRSHAPLWGGFTFQNQP